MSISSSVGEEKVAGILVPLFAIRREQDLGIGDLSGLKELVDWAADVGFGFIQLLPMNEMGPDNSPYNAISSIALDPLTLDLSPGAVAELDEGSFANVVSNFDLDNMRAGSVNYDAVRELKGELLTSAYESFERSHVSRDTERERAYLEFRAEEAQWLEDYCLYRLLMDREGGKHNWEQWPAEYNTLDSAREFLVRLKAEAGEEINRRLGYYAYIQFLCHQQWDEAAGYARGRGVKLMGDIPYGVSRSSGDVFADTEIFELNWYGGAPPETNFKDDAFVVRWGQNWGIPLYRWDEMEDGVYAWWRQRVSKQCRFCDIFRIDHALGFYRIYGFPWPPEDNAKYLDLSHQDAKVQAGGELPHFHPGPDDGEQNCARNREYGEKHLRLIQEAANNAQIVAEDLGLVPHYVPESLLSLGMAGMKVPQWESDFHGEFLDPTTYPHCSLATYATHDHEPMKSQWNRLRRIVLTNDPPEEVHEANLFLHRMARFARIPGLDDGQIPEYSDQIREALLARLFESGSRYASVMITDLLGLEDRFNVPGTLSEDNWSHRLPVTVREIQTGEPWQTMARRASDLLRRTGRVAQS